MMRILLAPSIPEAAIAHPFRVTNSKGTLIPVRHSAYQRYDVETWRSSHVPSGQITAAGNIQRIIIPKKRIFVSAAYKPPANTHSIIMIKMRIYLGSTLEPTLLRRKTPIR
jgi:hypothetical protein